MNGYRIRLCVGDARHYVTVATIDRAVAERVAVQQARELEQACVCRQAGLPVRLRCLAFFDEFERQRLPILVKGA